MSRNDDVWSEDHNMIPDMFDEAGVNFRWFTGGIRNGHFGFWSGKYYNMRFGEPTEVR